MDGPYLYYIDCLASNDWLSECRAGAAYLTSVVADDAFEKWDPNKRIVAAKRLFFSQVQWNSQPWPLVGQPGSPFNGAGGTAAAAAGGAAGASIQQRVTFSSCRLSSRVISVNGFSSSCLPAIRNVRFTSDSTINSFLNDIFLSHTVTFCTYT